MTLLKFRCIGWKHGGNATNYGEWVIVAHTAADAATSWHVATKNWGFYLMRVVPYDEAEPTLKELDAADGILLLRATNQPPKETWIE